MIYITGDTHRNFRHIELFCKNHNTSKENDYIIILGDSGINYTLDYRDDDVKKYLYKLPINFIIVHGNHEERASNIPCYKCKYVEDEKNEVYGKFFVDELYSNIMFTDIYGEYYFNNKCVYVIGGAYSVDKYYRLSMGYRWFESEQLSMFEKCEIWHQLRNFEYDYYDINIILSHTCPLKYEPREWFLEGIDQSTVDKSMEEFLDIVDDYVPYEKWYCGHYHGEKDMGNIEFLYNSIKEFK